MEPYLISLHFPNLFNGSRYCKGNITYPHTRPHQHQTSSPVYRYILQLWAHTLEGCSHHCMLCCNSHLQRLWSCELSLINKRLSQWPVFRSHGPSIQYTVFPQDFPQFPQDFPKIKSLFPNPKTYLLISEHRNEIICFAFGKA